MLSVSKLICRCGTVATDDVAAPVVILLPVDCDLWLHWSQIVNTHTNKQTNRERERERKEVRSEKGCNCNRSLLADLVDEK